VPVRSSPASRSPSNGSARLNPYAVAFRYGEPPAERVEPEEAEEIVASVTEWAGACILAAAEHADGSW